MRRRGFTLIELLVVVGIIVILLAILVPTLGHFKIKAQKTQCMALLSNLSSSISAYQARFGAYPGPATLAMTAPSGAASKNINGAQNMLLGLSYSINVPPPPGGATEALGTNPTTYTDISKPNGPKDLASMKPDGSFEQLSPFFTVAPNQVVTLGSSPAIPQRMAGLYGNSSNFPMVLDNFSDALPVLYFRRTPGIQSPPVSAIRDPNTPAAYVMEENSDIFASPSLTAAGPSPSTGRPLPQTQTGGNAPYSMWSGMDANAVADFQKMVVNASGNAARGGFLLVSAGPDRIYGTTVGGNTGSKTNDDVVLVGGD